MKLSRLSALIALISLTACAAAPAHAADTPAPAFIWIEGEKPAAVTGLPKPTVAGWGHKELLSGDTWLQVNIPEDKTKTDVASGGGVLRYDFTVAQAGDYEVWNRIGYEFVRSPFEWRVNGGAWKTVSPNDLTTDLETIETWNEVAWLKMGDAARLAPGTHALEIRLTARNKSDGKPEKLLYASDALCLTRGAFHPNGKYKPDEERSAPEDKQARENVFNLTPPPPLLRGEGEPEKASSVNVAPSVSHSGSPSPRRRGGGGVRSSVKLSGLWEVCRADEPLPKAVAEPFTDVPEHPFWTAIPVPGDKNTLRPDLVFAHRLWYRTRVSVPAGDAGKSFTIHFPQNNLNTTVVVNGVLCGFNKNPHAAFDVDVTAGIKPGQVNEIRVGIRDAWYGYSASPTNPLKLRKMFNIPLAMVGNGFQDLDYPVWHAWQSGILVAPTLSATGGVYASDVFVKPSVARKMLDVDVTVTEHSLAQGFRTVRCEVVDPKTGRVVHSLPESRYAVVNIRFQSAHDQPSSGLAPAEVVSHARVSGTWANPTLWWPDAPAMYRLRTTVSVDGKPVDVSETPFGFREWGSRGKDFTLNGVVWHGWADLNAGDTPKAFLSNYHKNNERFMRLMGYAQQGQTWLGMDHADALDLFDREGVVVRRCGTLDGEAIGYNALENDPELKKLYGSDTKVALQNNWRDQMVQQVKAERNHPSIQLWSIENEWLYINCINLYGDKMDEFERRAKDVSDAVRAADPTRLTMTDGGGANKDNSMPVHGNHYVYTGDPSQYPALAYEANPDGGGRGRWHWDEMRPRYLGEDYFATGINPADYAWIGGEETFQGKAATKNAVGAVERMLTEGYRWAGYGASHFWLGSEGAANPYNSFAPIAVFCRDYDTTFGGGQTVTRRMGLFNDGFHERRPLTFAWTLTAGGRTFTQGAVTKNVPPGESAKFPVSVSLPQVAPGARVEAAWNLSVKNADGVTLFTDSKPWSVLGVTSATAPSRVASAAGVTGKPTVLLYDPKNSVGKTLPRLGIATKPVLSLAALPQTAPAGTVLLVGRDALTAPESAASTLAAWASAGRAVIVLEQTNPLRYQALPAAIDTTGDTGSVAFADDLNHPALRGLMQKDFASWNGGFVYRAAYKKPTTGGRSLVQCHTRLEDTALVEMPAGKGLLLLSQLRIAETLPDNAVAQRLLANLVTVGAAYRQTFRPVAVSIAPGSPLAKALDATGVRYVAAPGALAALRGGAKLAVVEATPANLEALAASKPVVDAFTRGGGYLVLCGLTPAGLPAYNKIVGVNHMIRPFRRERVTFPARRDRLTAGLTLGDVVMQGGQKINNYTDDTFLSSDVFTYAVDYDEVGRFAKLPPPSFWGNADASNDHNPYNMVNGFTSADGWQQIFSIWAGSGDPKAIPFPFSVPQTVTRFEWIGNAFYDPTTKVEMTFDGKSPVVFDTAPNNEPQTFAVRAPGAAREIGIRIAAWEKRSATPIVGIDNVELYAKRPPEFYRSVRPLLNVGTLMEYPRGAGGIVLSNVLFKNSEEVPENARKKQRILGTILRNLNAPFGGGKTVLAGAGLKDTPIDISKQANQYRNEQGWFGDKPYSFGALPTGAQTFAGVTYQIYDFPTSPVPNAVMLGGSGVPGNLHDAVRGIPVNRKADDLFFLQAARIDQRRSGDEIKAGKQVELAAYVVHYADGKTGIVPVYAEINVDDYKQTGEPRALPGAQIAWTRRYPGTDQTAVAYSQQWTNPRPDVVITSVDLEYGKDRRGVPALLALTAADAK